MLIRRKALARPGAIIPMAAILTIVVLAMVAFAVDIGWVAVSQSELQNTADSAALAGAQALMEGHQQYQLTTNANTKATIRSTALASAKAKAILYASYNRAGGAGALVLQDSDIEFGFVDANNNYTASSGTGFPNTIKVVMRRDGTANPSLPLFFGKALGVSTTNLQVTASATLYTMNVDNLSTSSFNSGILPITYDVNDWNRFIATGQAHDGSAQTDSAGVPKLHVYPSIKDKGNFGQLSLNDSHTGDSTEVSWVNDGVPASDIQVLKDHKLIPLSKHDPNAVDWQGNNGFKASLVMTINAKQGQTFLLPLYKPVNPSADPDQYQAGAGQGSNYYFNIVQFVGVRIVSSGNRELEVQPAPVIDPNAMFDAASLAPAGTTTTSPSSLSYTTPKLTR